MKATNPTGELKTIEDCYIDIPFYGEIQMRVLPEISDSKNATYSDEPVIGRTNPLKVYSHSENRSISWTAYFIVNKKEDISKNISDFRAIQAAVYPRADGQYDPYAPPPVCAIKCGKLLGDNELCVVLKSYNVKFPTDVSWDEETFLPFKFSVDMSWDVVYQSDDLPGFDRILREGR